MYLKHKELSLTDCNSKLVHNESEKKHAVQTIVQSSKPVLLVNSGVICKRMAKDFGFQFFNSNKEITIHLISLLKSRNLEVS